MDVAPVTAHAQVFGHADVGAIETVITSLGITIAREAPEAPIELPHDGEWSGVLLWVAVAEGHGADVAAPRLRALWEAWPVETTMFMLLYIASPDSPLLVMPYHTRALDDALGAMQTYPPTLPARRILVWEPSGWVTEGDWPWQRPDGRRSRRGPSDHDGGPTGSGVRSPLRPGGPWGSMGAEAEPPE